MKNIIRDFWKCDFSRLDTTEEKSKLEDNSKLKHKDEKWKNGSEHLIPVRQKSSNVCVTIVPEGKEKEHGAEEICKEQIMVRNFPKLVRDINAQIQGRSPPPFSTSQENPSLTSFKMRGKQTHLLMGGLQVTLQKSTEDARYCSVSLENKICHR